MTELLATRPPESKSHELFWETLATDAFWSDVLADISVI